ncbi:MAG: hypothetical protein ACF788_00070, partial [Novipirellula sp. JB048]
MPRLAVGTGLPNWCPDSSRSTSTGRRPEYEYGIFFARTSTISRRRRLIIHFKSPDFAARLHR